MAERTHELQEWQLRMTQSIAYALLIQKSILPQENQLRRLFKDYFLIWQPRDTVGGDFYWLNELSDGTSLLFAVIDCTGHGVPGALVSMTVNAAPEKWHNMLREIGHKPLLEQKTMIKDMIKQMLLLENQRDDITIVALQL
ncbi:MAG: hypothetical protein RBS43_01375 [Candidatus Cloacimonas sp.]|nr:hypothetical protein [Candidatus Cloacimonas sp.]